VNRKYIIQKETNPDMHLQAFNWQPGMSSVTLTWEWPIERSIRFVLIFECENENPILKDLISQNHPHEVIARDLASHFIITIPEGRRKFLICPAYFDDSQQIVICTPEIITDWIYKKTEMIAEISYKPLAFSQYKKASIKITPADMELTDLAIKAISYVICPQESDSEQYLETYPIDAVLMTDYGHLYIDKNHTVKFILNPDHAHLIDLVTVGG